ncbi:hypothetical protein [Crocinitomix catalasitica]|uniref:hypothetical protein n=1 Tax=Crocinitomix catalasitica TaxID=184607 RepID=UPI000480D26E|nr:hypothetical protein [Crocinitomix catalasitica]
MAEYKEIIIDWKFKERWDPAEFERQHNENVLYQIYCDSHVYGRDTLAYIGKTDQKFSKRLSQHERSFWQFANNVNYAVGEIVDHNFDNLEIPESILIANHKPFYNKNFIHDIPAEAKKEKIIIINNGHHGLLKNSCTNFWWVE